MSGSIQLINLFARNIYGRIFCYNCSALDTSVGVVFTNAPLKSLKFERFKVHVTFGYELRGKLRTLYRSIHLS